jgi:hypothetical protein
VPIGSGSRSAAPRLCGIASEAGIIAAAPAPWIARAASRRPSDGASAAASDMAVNSPTPASMSLRRPTTSATRPAGASSAAKVTA